ncbi:unnamed protein product [Prunus armeniaca]|uniref:Uncharacterized protein n=1 Tax=Prunus armeniaca TaxID=36596 RepID=A0A6J5TJ98_PRUAR|nr:unnamed protein product [Prunus armeniaca]
MLLLCVGIFCAAALETPETVEMAMETKCPECGSLGLCELFYKGAAFAFNYHAGAAVNDSVVENRGRIVILRTL